MTKEAIQKTSLYVPVTFWKKIRNLAIDQHKSANALVLDALIKEYGGEKQ